MKNNKPFLLLVRLIAVICSSLLQSYVILAYIRPEHLLSSGFTGVAILLDVLTINTPVKINTSLAIILLNLPVAIMCYKSISHKFVILSSIQFFCTSLFLNILQFNKIFDDTILNVIFGGFLYGLSIVIALKSNASTGGTDFIALYFSNKFNKTVWQYVFIFNCIIICIFGITQGWIYAGYSIIFQFISTKTIDHFYTRYERITLQIITKTPNELITAYCS